MAESLYFEGFHATIGDADGPRSAAGLARHARAIEQDGMQTVSRAVAAAFVLAITAGAAACGGDEPTPAPQPPAATPITWHEIGSWSGRGSRQTESFEVSPSPMRLSWRTTSETAPGAGRLTVTLHSAVSGRPLQTIVEARGVASGTADVADEQRWSHFVVDAENVEWQMTLEQPFAATPR